MKSTIILILEAEKNEICLLEYLSQTREEMMYVADSVIDRKMRMNILTFTDV